jgi:undecaprenyl-diphosphatase
LKYGDVIDEKLSSWHVVAPALVIFGLLMLLAERMGKQQREIGRMSYVDYMTIGISQAVALIPGVSRSGITITAGLFRGLSREAAARFSFLLSMPIVFGVGVYSAKHINFNVIGPKPFACGVISAAVFGYLSIGFLLKFLKSKPMTAFVIYRICLAVAIVGLFWGK